MNQTNGSPDGPSPEVAQGDADRLRATLEGVGYNESGINGRLGLTGDWLKPIHTTLFRHELPRHLSKLKGDDPQATLIRTFFLGVPVTKEAFHAAVAPTEAVLWEAAGLVRARDEEILARARITPVEGLYLAIDAMWEKPSDDAHLVMAISGTTLALAALTIRRRFARALDLGTGCGILALLAARHCDEVVGTDLNPRAIRRAAFNSRLNGLPNVRWTVGDLFGPVEGERFDLIIANPPFVVSPEHERMYRDSGRPLDQMCEQIVRRAPEFLAPGGYLQMLFNWVHVRGQDWHDRLAGWVAGSGCDAWVLRFDTHDPADYATHWLGQLSTPEPGAHPRKFDAWMRYYEEGGVEAISFGLIILRHTPGRSNWFHCEDAPERSGPCHQAIFERFARHDFVDSLRDDAALLGARLRASPDLAWKQTLRPSGTGWELRSSRLTLATGLAYTIDTNPGLVALVSACRGDRPLGEVMRDVATRFGQDPERVTATGLDGIRDLIEMGFLLPA